MPVFARALAGLAFALTTALSQTSNGSELRGELRIARDGSEWRATLSGIGTEFRVDGENIRFSLPRNLGSFRGSLTDRQREIRGFWLQPPGGSAAQGEPVDPSQTYATPVVLLRVAPDSWRGAVPPFEQHAPDITSRPPDQRIYAYSKPPETGDGWTTARATDVGFDEVALTRLVQAIIDSDPAARRPRRIHSLLVARHGKLVLEEYFFGFDRDMPHDLRSAGKTFASVMLGAAIMQGAQLAPETRIYELLAAKGPFANPDPRKTQITLAQLMTHTAGLACDDNDDASPGNEYRMQGQRGQPDWWKYTLDLPLAHDPGSSYAYCSANINLVGAALTAGTGSSLPELFERTVARPLQLGIYHWNLMPTGEGYLGGGAFVRPRDLLKVGQAYLDGGAWHGRKIVDASWVKRSTAPYVHISPETTGLSPDQFSDAYLEADDAYAWHLNTLAAPRGSCRDYEAVGNGGQYLIVVPELDLAVVLTGGNYGQGGIWLKWRKEIVAYEIIPALSAEHCRSG
jgi:CubicO group peptidase (beta-lactamase class C family)